MWVVAAVFAGVVAIVYGAYWLLVVRDEEQLLQRLKPGGGDRASRTLLRGVLKDEERLSAVGPLHEVLEKSAAVGPLRRMLEQSGIRLNLASFLLLTACLGLAGYLAGFLVTRMLLVGLLFALIAGSMPYFWVRRAKNKRMYQFEEQFPEAIDLIARALRAGHALPTGLSMVADEMGPPVGTEFRILYDEQNFGLNVSDAMRNFARRIPVLDARFFVTAVLTQREAGGNLAEVLDNLSSVIRERFKVKRQIRVISAHGRITGVVLACLPPSLAAVTLLLNPDYLGTLLGDELGRQMIMVALTLQVVGTLIMRKIINIEY
jgi:tight adherence protein B